jgi:hypothetical protein
VVYRLGGDFPSATTLMMWPRKIIFDARMHAHEAPRAISLRSLQPKEISDADQRLDARAEIKTQISAIINQSGDC